jgi:hypothetical protein
MIIDECWASWSSFTSVCGEEGIGRSRREHDQERRTTANRFFLEEGQGNESTCLAHINVSRLAQVGASGAKATDEEVNFSKKMYEEVMPNPREKIVER